MSKLKTYLSHKERDQLSRIHYLAQTANIALTARLEMEDAHGVFSTIEPNKTGGPFKLNQPIADVQNDPYMQPLIDQSPIMYVDPLMTVGQYLLRSLKAFEHFAGLLVTKKDNAAGNPPDRRNIVFTIKSELFPDLAKGDWDAYAKRSRSNNKELEKWFE